MSSLVFIPEPKKVTKRRGTFTLPNKAVVGIPNHSLHQVAQDVGRFFGAAFIRVAMPGQPDTVTIHLKKGLKHGGYRLEIKKDGIIIEADDASAALHAVQTIAQIAMQSPKAEWPCVVVDDWPDFAERGLYYDVCRGRVPKLERLMELADHLAHYKINQLQLYIEHTFSFRNHPDIGKGASPLTPDDILELDLFCAERGIELVPSLASFGHLATVLKHPQYHELCEDYGKKEYKDPAALNLHSHMPPCWSLAPANPKIYDFLDSLFAEFLPLFRSKRFNVCCDDL